MVRNSVNVLTRWKNVRTAKGVQACTYLKDHSALEYNKHECREHGVIPVLVETPQRHAKHLEDEERGDCVFGKKLGEFGDGNMTLVWSVRGLQRFYVGGIAFASGGRIGENTAGRLEDRKGRRGISLVRYGRESILGV